MEYKEYFIEKNNCYIVIRDVNRTKIYMSKIYSDNEEKTNEIGKKIIDLGIDIMKRTNKTPLLSFQSIYALNKDNEIKEYKVNEEGKRKKQDLRNKFKKMIILLVVADLILICLSF